MIFSFPPPPSSLPSPQEWNRTLPLISRRAASRPQRAAAVTGGRECLFISLFLTLPKGTHPLKTVNGLWFRSVCAQLSYLIKYLRPLIGPSGSGPCGHTPQRSPRQVSNAACMRTNAPGVHAKLKNKKGRGNERKAASRVWVTQWQRLPGGGGGAGRSSREVQPFVWGGGGGGPLPLPRYQLLTFGEEAASLQRGSGPASPREHAPAACC